MFESDKNTKTIVLTAKKYLKNSWPFLLGLLLCLNFITLNITGKSFSQFPGDLGDARFNTYLLENVHKFITGQEQSLWNAPFMYPEHNVITYSDNLIGTAPFYSIFRIAGFDRITSFQCWFVLMCILSFTSCYFFLNWIFKNNYASVIGAMVFAFSMALQSQIAHAQTFPRFAIPLVFWFAMLFLKELKPIYFFGTLLMVVYELYCGIYLGLMLMVPVGVFLLISFLYKRKKIIENIKGELEWSIKLLLSAVINTLLLLPLMIPYIKRANKLGMHSYKDVVASIPTIKSFFFSYPGSLLWDFLKNTGIKYPAWWDHQIFPGGIAMLSFVLFCGIAFIKLIKKDALKKVPFNKPLLILFITSVCTFILFTRFRGYSLYWFIYELPGYGSMHSITRIINIELFFFAVATAFVFNMILRKQHKYIIPLFIFISTAFIIDNYYKARTADSTNKHMAQMRVENLTQKMSNIPSGAVVSYEPQELKGNAIFYQIDAMLAAQSLNLKTVNGYSSTSPHGYADYWNHPDKESREKWFKTKNFKPDTLYVIH